MNIPPVTEEDVRELVSLVAGWTVHNNVEELNMSMNIVDGPQDGAAIIATFTKVCPCQPCAGRRAVSDYIRRKAAIFKRKYQIQDHH